MYIMKNFLKMYVNEFNILLYMFYQELIQFIKQTDIYVNRLKV